MTPKISHLTLTTLFAASLAGCATAPLQPSIAQPVSASADQCADTSEPSGVILDHAQSEQLKGILSAFINKGIAPGAVLKIEQYGELKIDIAIGLADRDGERPMQSDALFRLYSMTKPITSVAAMRLVEAGQLSLDDPVARFIPEFGSSSVYGDDDEGEVRIERPILIRDLLQQTAGIPYRTDTSQVGRIYAKRGIPAGPGVAGDPTDGSAPVSSLSELASRVSKTPLQTQPGQEWTYGNATDVLGHVLEIVTSKELPEVISEQVLSPLKMTDTAFNVAPSKRSRLTTAYANKGAKSAGKGVLASLPLDELERPSLVPVDRRDASIYAGPPSIAYGGAGLVATANDYLRFTQMMRQGGVIDGKRILDQSTVRQMTSNQISETAREASPTLDGLGFGWGFAVEERPTEEKPVFPQNGYFWGGAASTFFWVDPDSEVSGVLMMQVFGGDTSSVWLALMRQLYGKGGCCQSKCT